MQVAILGAGLSGLTTAYLLQSHGVEFRLLEARNRPGERIWTKTLAGDTRAEAGATWFTGAHQHVTGLLKRLGLSHFPQYTAGIGLMASPFEGTIEQFQVPQGQPDSFRIGGGSSALIATLSQHLGGTSIELNTKIAKLDFRGARCKIRSEDAQLFDADVVVSTLPPLLFCNTVSVTPALPASWTEIAAQTHTWMSSAVKFYVAYKQPFWRISGFSGMAFSHGGLIPEMYDHTSQDEQTFALKGFLSPQAYKLSLEARRKAVLDQLAEYFGPEAEDALEYGDTLWGLDPLTHLAHLPELMPHQNNGHPALAQILFDGRLMMSGTRVDSSHNAIFRQ